jgi:IS605 OrfB family transposase
LTKSYQLKIYANQEKLSRLDNLLSFWKEEVNKKISVFWDLDTNFKSSYPPKEYCLGGRLVCDASKKAWQIVKLAKKTKQENMPVFKGSEIDLNSASFRFINPETKEFDFWIKVTCLNKSHRIPIPCKKIGVLNKALETGKLKNSAKIIKYKSNYYLKVFVEFIETVKENINKIGIDVGLSNTVVTSDGGFLGEDLKDLRIRAKWRKYNFTSAFKQGLNRVTKEIINFYPNTDFILEDLYFKGKNKRGRIFRRRNNNWAYKHLGKMLEQHGKTEGFKVIYVNPIYTSQTCPKCDCVNKLNRVGDKFNCKSCGYENHSDIVGAINILERVNGEHCVPRRQVL